MAESTLHANELTDNRPLWRRRIGLVLAVLLGLAVLYYLGGMFWLHAIDDDPSFGAETTAPDGGSRSVAIAAELIDREINQNRWVANDPFFMPGAALDNMPNFQRGIIAAVSRFGIELADQIARVRGSSEIDPDLNAASGLLRYPGTVWIFDLSTSWAPTASSESQYRRALVSLRNYNERLASGEATFEVRADNLQTTLDRFIADIGSSSASLEQHLEQRGGAWFDFTADDLFYATKGRLYAYYLLLRGLGIDFDSVIRERGLQAAWGQMQDSLHDAATLQPWVVVNGAPDAQFWPSHLASQGFYLLRSRAQLREISNILLK